MSNPPLVFFNGRKNTYGVSDRGVFNAPSQNDTPNSLAPIEQILRRPDVENLDFSQIAEVLHCHDKKFSVNFIAKKGSMGIFIETNDANAQQQFVDAILARFPKSTPRSSSSLRTELLGPIVLGAIVTGIGALVFSVAQEMANGTWEPTRRFGKAWIVAKIVNFLASILGTTGTLIVFGALIALFIFWAIQAIRHRHTVTRWKVG